MPKPPDRYYRKHVECGLCGKLGWYDRKDAKEEAKRTARGQTHVGVYRCVLAQEDDSVAQLWHIGHLPAAVRQGSLTREDYRNQHKHLRPREVTYEQ